MGEEPKKLDLAAEWRTAAARVARQVNLGWWVQTLAAPLIILGIAGASTLLLVRRHVPDLPAWQLGLWTAGAVVLLGGIAFLIARRRFENVETSMVRIEDTMQLRNGLSAARAGVAPWPAMPRKVDPGLGWNWQRVVIPPVAALALLLGGLLIPVAAVSQDPDDGPDEPLAWEQIEADLERLEQDELIDENYLEETRKKLEELRQNDEDEWFSHSSLEATDSLKQQHNSELERLERELERADRALGSLQKNAGGMPQERKDQLMNQFDQALQGLQNGALKPNPELLNQLRELDPNNLGQLNQEQLDQLRENLRQAGQACKDCQGGGEGGGQGDEWLDELLDGDGNGGGEGQCPGGDQPGDGPGGKGGVNRGPGHAPGVLGAEGETLETGDLEAMEAKDLSRSLPGDLLQLQDGEHEVDENATRDGSGGSVDATGAGGDRVWRESLDPDEQRALKRFFE
ncbi:hypothetical protein [Haloferula sp. A504]|uniref:hypothetical protein n=1 Tax=Haloferula sp. A504 TaxID=3373601 RepID=UPI0031C8E7C1|nr:cbb3-type cytochrome c oxidase subunit I [Verrucomicrobiaceae bacterium E54]